MQNYTITHPKGSAYIILKIEGDVTRSFSMECNVKSHKLGRKLGIDKYLVDLTGARNVEEPAQNYQFAYGDMRTNKDIDRTAMIAMVVDQDDHTHDFIETLARNSGLNVTIFRDRALAEKHLQK